MERSRRLEIRRSKERRSSAMVSRIGFSPLLIPCIPIFFFSFLSFAPFPLRTVKFKFGGKGGDGGMLEGKEEVQVGSNF